MKRTTKPKRAKPRRGFWVCRDAATANVAMGMAYQVYVGQKPVQGVLTNWQGLWVGSNRSLCDKMFHRATDIRLKPGAGPVRVRMVLDEEGQRK